MKAMRRFAQTHHSDGGPEKRLHLVRGQIRLQAGLGDVPGQPEPVHRLPVEALVERVLPDEQGVAAWKGFPVSFDFAVLSNFFCSQNFFCVSSECVTRPPWGLAGATISIRFWISTS